ncbi:MAG: hypothetical protein U0871_17565 [Gemmataceae bacterium]
MSGFSPEEPCVPLSRVNWTLDEPLIHPRWRTETVLALARSIQTERAFDRMPILADALEEAGCDNQFVLLHCRTPNQHIPHCWVISAVLKTPNPSQVAPAESPVGATCDRPPVPPRRWSQMSMHDKAEATLRVHNWLITKGCLLIFMLWVVVVALVELVKRWAR